MVLSSIPQHEYSYNVLSNHSLLYFAEQIENLRNKPLTDDNNTLIDFHERSGIFKMYTNLHTRN